MLIQATQLLLLNKKKQYERIFLSVHGWTARKATRTPFNRGQHVGSLDRLTTRWSVTALPIGIGGVSSVLLADGEHKMP